MKKKRLKEFVIKEMKKTIIQFMLAFCIVGINYANEADAQTDLNHKIYLNVQDESLAKVLKQIEKQVRLSFVFSSKLIQSNQKVNATFVDKSLSFVLDNLLTPRQLSFEVVDNMIILKRLEGTKTSFIETLPNEKFSLVKGAATFIVSGTITDEAGEALVGATVALEGSGKGTFSDENGYYSLTLDDAEKNGKLSFSFVGYETQIVDIQNKTLINISLKDAGTLSEVVIVGYGSQKRSDVTGSVAKFKNENLAELPVSRLDQALQGKMAGVQIQNTSGESGTDPKVVIRGVSSINAGSSPLVVVDGHPVPDGLAFVNMGDVESVEVLKDAASAAIYGSRGSSGVILITTKTGKAEKPKYNLKVSNGFKEPYKLYSRMTSTEYLEFLYDEAAQRAKDPSIVTQAAPATDVDKAAYAIEQVLRDGQTTDWQKELVRDANVKNIQLSVAGGSKDLKYFFSAGFQDDQGMIFANEYKRYNIRSRLDAQLNKRMKLSVNIAPSFSQRQRSSEQLQDFLRFPSWLPVRHTEKTAEFVRGNPLYADIKAGDYAQPRHFNQRTYSGIMPDGTPWTNAVLVDPFGSAQNSPRSVSETRTLTGNDYRVQNAADLTINLLPGLDFKTLASAYVTYTTNQDFAKKNSNRAGDVSRGVYSNRFFLDLLNENTLNFKKVINKHTISLLAGFTAQKTNINSDQAIGLNFADDNISTLNTALTKDQIGTFNTKNQIGLLSYLGRVTYGYQNKYLFSASYRADGSSYFAPGKKWGKFPSLSVGWIASEEKILKDITWLSQLKFRGSYGVTGNNRIVDFAFVDLLYASNYPLGPGTGTVTTGQVPSRDILSNADITWEQTFQFNGGLDLSILENTVTVGFDIYRSKTDRLLLRQAIMGFAGVPQTWNNIGSLQNDGVELEISSNNVVTENFTWTTSANISRTRNKILELGTEAFLFNQGERTEIYRNKVGDPLVQFFGFKTDGVWLSQAQITESGIKSNLSNALVPGGLKLVDLDGNGILNADDRTVIGSPYPDFTWGVSNNFKYKAFDLSFMFQGVEGGSLINGDPNYLEIRRTVRAYSNNRWLSPGFPGDGQTPYSSNGFSWLLTDYVVEDASYVALREILVGYSLPNKLTKRVGIKGLRIYLTGQNLWFKTAKGYRGLNPESRFQTGPYNTPLIDGYQRGSFPVSRTFLFGLDLNF